MLLKVHEDTIDTKDAELMLLKVHEDTIVGVCINKQKLLSPIT